MSAVYWIRGANQTIDKIKVLLLILVTLLPLGHCIYGQQGVSLRGFQRIAGICVDGQSIYTISGRKLFSFDLTTSLQKNMKDIGTDTLISDKLFKKAVYLYGIMDESSINECRKEIRNFRLMNVSCHRHYVYVSVMFHTAVSVSSKDRYAILQFDTTLTFRNYFIIRSFPEDKWSSFSPFQATEFSREGFILLPKLIFQNDSAKYTHGGYEFRKDKNELMFSFHSGKYFSLPLSISVQINKGTLITPTIYPVPGSGSRMFYAFPYPYLFDVRTYKNIDPYHLQKKLDSLFLHPDSKTLDAYNEKLLFELAQSRNGNVVLAAQQFADNIYLVVSNKDTSKTDIVKCDLNRHENKLLTLDIPLRDHYFVFGNNKLYCLVDNETTQIKIIDLYKLKF